MLLVVEMNQCSCLENIGKEIYENHGKGFHFGCRECFRSRLVVEAKLMRKILQWMGRDSGII